jgi:solute carrier family 45 protein 1/2/4
MQPIVGSLSDNSTSRFGRRRPFLLAGSLAVVTAFMFIGWSKEIIGLFFREGSSMVNFLFNNAKFFLITKSEFVYFN